MKKEGTPIAFRWPNWESAEQTFKHSNKYWSMRKGISKSEFAIDWFAKLRQFFDATNITVR